jgi:hypothetical protein
MTACFGALELVMRRFVHSSHVASWHDCRGFLFCISYSILHLLNSDRILLINPHIAPGNRDDREGLTAAKRAYDQKHSYVYACGSMCVLPEAGRTRVQYAG